MHYISRQNKKKFVALRRFTRRNQPQPSRTRHQLSDPGWSTTNTLVLGLGNPIMTDDRIGIHVTRMLQARLPERSDIVFKELSVSGLRLVEEILGFDHVIIVDSHSGKDTEAGRIRKFTPVDFTDTMHPGAPHGMNFATAIEFYRNLEPDRIPKSIEIYTIDINSEFNFGEQLSPEVEKAGEELVTLLVHQLTSS